MRLEHYIADLLYRYNCVIIPGFGAFLANTTTAKLGQKDRTLYPPAKNVSFNQQLTKNDGLLVSYIADIKTLPYEEMLELINTISKQWQENLESGKTLYFENLGKLWMGEEQKIQFAPQEGHNFLITSFGLSSFSASPIVREALKEEVVALEEKVPFTITPERRQGPRNRNWLKYAAIFLLLVSTGTSAYQMRKQRVQKLAVMEKDVREQVSHHIQEATFFKANPIELPALNIKVAKKLVMEEEPKHYIVAGVYRFKKNADRKIQQLSGKGYSPVYLGTNANGLHQVAYAGFFDSDEALRYLRKVKANVSRDAWMISKR